MELSIREAKARLAEAAAGMDFDEAAVVRRETGLDGADFRLPPGFDDPPFSRRVPGLWTRRQAGSVPPLPRHPRRRPRTHAFLRCAGAEGSGGGPSPTMTGKVRIVAGALRGRALAAPSGSATRPTADRVRQALFDMLLHAPWGGRALIDGAHVLDAFAGTGALGLEALSRGAARATFLERDRAALAALRANVAACRAEALCDVRAADACAPPPAPSPAGLAFLDPPYGLGLIPRAAAALRAAGWIAPGAVVVTETARDEAPAPLGEMLAERAHGAARLAVWRVPQ